jgi:hypothetical protein
MAAPPLANAALGVVGRRAVFTKAVAAKPLSIAGEHGLGRDLPAE